MPEEHGALKLKVPKDSDYSPGQADVPRAFREHADSIAERFTASSGRLLIAQPSDVAKFVAMKGDGTIDAEGNFQLGAKVVDAPEIADALKPSKGAAAGTEALRALGTSASTAAAGNDSRLSDERLPTAPVREALGINGAGLVRRGKKVIETEQSRESEAFGTLTTADEVASVVLPADGLLLISYVAWVKGLTGSRVAIFINGVQLKVWQGNDSAPLTQEAIQGDGGGTGADFGICSTFGGGLILGAATGEGGLTDVTTGRVAGQRRGYQSLNASGSVEVVDPGGRLCEVELPAGTYNVSVRYRKTGGGKITAKNRKLRVKAEAFL